MKRPILITIAAAILVGTSAGAANLTVDTSTGIGPGSSATCPSGCRLSVNMTSDTVKAFLVSDHPTAERTYRFTFYINPNTINMPNKSGIRIVEARKGSPGAVILLQGDLFFKDGLYKVRFSTFNDAGVIERVGQLTLNPDKNAFIEAEWQASSGASTNDGLMRIRKGTKVKERTGIDNFVNGTDGIDQVRFGYVKAGDSGIAGSFFLDDFSSFRSLEPLN